MEQRSGTDIDKLEKIQNRAMRFIKRDYRSRERGCITKMRKELELETLEERRQSLRLILMYKVVEGLVPALPTDAFVTFSKRKRQIKPKTFENCVTINPVEKHKTNNTKCLNIPNSRTAQYQNSFSWTPSYVGTIYQTPVILNSRLESTTEITQNKHVKVLHYFVDDIK
jgi:hypothetical protein